MNRTGYSTTKSCNYNVLFTKINDKNFKIMFSASVFEQVVHRIHFDVNNYF